MSETKPAGVRMSAHKIDNSRLAAGEWVELADEFEGAAIKTHGLTDSYFDAIGRGMQRAARGFGGDLSKVPTSVRRAVNVKALCDTLVDVRGFVDDDGKPLSLDAFKAMLADRDYLAVLEAVTSATSSAGRVKAEETKDAAGN